MNRVHIVFASHNQTFLKSQGMTEQAILRAAKYTYRELLINWDIDIVVSDQLYNIIIAEDGLGARAYPTGDFILVGIDSNNIKPEFITESMVHELCHEACFRKNPEKRQSLIDEILFEGIATYFEAEFAKKQAKRQFFIKTILERTNEENQRIFRLLEPKLNKRSYNKNTVFYHGDTELPRWAGYSLGHYLITQYLDKTHQNISDAIGDKYADFKRTLQL